MKTERYIRLALFGKWQRVFDYLKKQDVVNVKALLKIVEIQKTFASE
jgi:hypothetical protein